MTGLATTVLHGDAAYLVATQADLLTSAGGRDIYRLKTPDLRIGVYDAESRRLVIFDAAALAALAVDEVAGMRRPPTRPYHVDPIAVVSDPPSQQPFDRL